MLDLRLVEPVGHYYSSVIGKKERLESLDVELLGFLKVLFYLGFSEG